MVTRRLGISTLGDDDVGKIGIDGGVVFAVFVASVMAEDCVASPAL